MRPTSRFAYVSLPMLLAPLALMACGDDDSSGDDTPPAIDASPMPTGRDYYEGPESAALGAANNEATCATCHSDDGTVAGFSGKTFKDIAYRTAFKGGMAPTLLDGTNACVTGWMGGANPLAATDPRYVALKGFLESISSDAVTDPNPLAPEVLADLAAYEADYAGGSATAGQAVYMASCAVCHGGGLQVGPAQAPPPAALKALSVGAIAQQVRTSGPVPDSMAGGPDTRPGPMPFFEPTDLSQQQLKDVIAFIKQ